MAEAAAMPVLEVVLAGTGEPHRFTAFAPDGQGGRLAEQSFEWRTDSTALALDLGALERAALSGRPPEHDLHVRFGRQLFSAVFAGPVGELWRQRLRQRRRRPLRLVLRFDPSSARPLLNLPWEYLHDSKDFLALNWRSPLCRLPWGLESEALPALSEPLRLLVVIAAPTGLEQNMVLNSAREEDLILAATSAARQSAGVEVVFAANGSLEGLETALREHDPHILHFTGHGLFDPVEDTGRLLMEAEDGGRREVPNQEFAQLLERSAPSLRLVFLSACQSAVAPRQEGYADLAPRLLEADIPAVVAMQFRVLNRSAMDFGATFYRGVAAGEPLDQAMVEARGRLAREGLNSVDFATPVLFLADPGCLRVSPEAGRAPGRPVALDLTGLTTAQHFAGRSSELRLLQTNLDPERGPWRAAVLHGLGGMGKTVLAARLAERMRARLDGVKSLRMTPTSTAQWVLEQLVAFLLLSNARFNLAQITELSGMVEQGKPLEAKAARLIEILRRLRLLLVFDNYEDVLSEAQPVSRAGGLGSEADPDLSKLVRLLVEGVAGPSRLLFTSRVDFSPLEAGRLTDAVGHLGLGEMGFRDAVYLMENMPPLNQLPVALVSERPGQSVPVGLSMRELHGRLGGHPYTLNLFAEHAHRSSVEALLEDLSGVRQELLEFTLLERAVAQLPERAAELLGRAAIFEEPVPTQGLAYLLGDEQGQLPSVEAEVAALLGWGLLAQPPGSELYAMPVLVREWGLGRMSGEQRLALLRRAAGYWLAVGRESRSLQPELNAHHYLFEAGDYEEADDLVAVATEYLFRWGQYDLLHQLLSQSLRTLTGLRRTIALGNLAIVHQHLGDYARAREYQQRALAEFQAAGDRANVAITMHQLGILHERQGEYELARELYQQSLDIRQELGHRAGVAASFAHLGFLHQRQGEYERARELYQQSLNIYQDLGDRVGVASSLHELGMLHQDHGEYERARELYQQSMDIRQELGDRAGLATSLQALGILHQQTGQYERARQLYQQSLDIEQELGDRAGAALSLHELGILQDQEGDYERARLFYQQSLDIKQELGDRAGVAASLHQLGNLHYHKGDYEPARQFYQQSLATLQELGDRVGVAKSLHSLGNLHQLQGEYGLARQLYQQSLDIKQEVGDRAGMATSLHELGTLHRLWGEYEQAGQLYQQSLDIKQELGDRAGVAASLNVLGMLQYLQGEYEQAGQLYQQSLDILQELGDHASVAASLHALGMLQYLQGGYEQAHQFYQQSLDILQELGDRVGVARSFHELGILHQDKGDYERARQLYQQSLDILQELGDRAGVALTLAQLGLLLEQQGDLTSSVTVMVQALQLFEQLKQPEAEQARRDLTRLYQALGEDAFIEAVQQADDVLRSGGPSPVTSD